MAANPALPAAVTALPESVREAMGRAWGQAVVETLNRLATAPVEGKGVAYDLRLTAAIDAGAAEDIRHMEERGEVIGDDIGFGRCDELVWDVEVGRQEHQTKSGRRASSPPAVMASR